MLAGSPAYPPPPWNLAGWGIATVGLVDAKAAADYVPAGTQLVTVVPGKTLGGLVFLAYERGTLTYRELNVVAGLVRRGTRFAFVLPRLYVDSAASLAGGRAIWGVPKEMATFEIGHEIGLTTIDVRQGAHGVCRIRCSVPVRGLRLPLPMPALGERDEELLFFTGRMAARLSLARAAVELPPDSEFGGLNLTRPKLAVRCEDLTLRVPAPEVVLRPARARAAAYSTS
jgi:hypothetical protein